MYPGVVPYDWQVPIGRDVVLVSKPTIDEIAVAEGGASIKDDVYPIAITPVEVQEDRGVTRARRSSRGIFTPFMNAVGRVCLSGYNNL
jgi:hypothetical protein